MLVTVGLFLMFESWQQLYRLFEGKPELEMTSIDSAVSMPEDQLVELL